MIRAPLTHSAFLAALLASLGGAAVAQEERPLTLSVHPSGIEPDPQTRLEQLLARRERRNDYLFRPICRGCGNSERFSGSGVFEPAAELGRKPAAVEE